MVRKEDKAENTFLPFHTFLPGSPSLLHSQLLYLPSLGDGERGLWSICNSSSLLFILYHTAPGPAGESLLWDLDHLPTPPPLGALRAVSHTLPLIPHCWGTFCPSLLRLSLRCCHRGCGAQLSPAVGRLKAARTGCSRGMFTEAALQTMPASSGYLHLVQHLSKPGDRMLNPCWGLLHRHADAQDFCNELYGMDPLLKSCGRLP